MKDTVNLSKPIDARTLRDCEGYLALPYAIMKASGAAVRTMGALFNCVDAKTRSTFASASYLGSVASLPTKTVRLHLGRLQRDRWIDKRAPRGRRTCTIALTKQAVQVRRNGQFATLPRWWSDHDHPSAGLVYATILGEHCKREEVIEQDVPGGLDETDGYVPHLRQFSLRKLQDLTGLSRPTISAAKTTLREWGLIDDYQTSASSPMTIILIDPRW